MSTQTPAPQTAAAFTPTGHDLSFGGVLRSEWIKLRSIRSTIWCFLILIALTVGFGALLGTFISTEGVPAGEATQSLATQSVTAGATLGALVVSVLGVLVISGEYGTGMIRSTLTAVPGRLPALFGKAIVFGVVTFLVSALAFALTVALTVPMLSGKGLEVDLGDGDYWLTLLGGLVYLTLVGLIAFSIGAIVRNTAGGIAVALGILLAAPIVLNIVGALTQLTWLQSISAFLPSEAGSRLMTYPSDTPLPAPDGLVVLDHTQALLVLLAWLVVTFTAAAVLLKRRDV